MQVNTDMGQGLEWKKSDSLRVSQMKSLRSDSDTVILTHSFVLEPCLFSVFVQITSTGGILSIILFLFSLLSQLSEREREQKTERERERKKQACNTAHSLPAIVVPTLVRVE